MVVGLGAGLLILTSILLMTMALACLHRRQKMISKLESQVKWKKSWRVLLDPSPRQINYHCTIEYSLHVARYSKFSLSYHKHLPPNIPIPQPSFHKKLPSLSTFSQQLYDAPNGYTPTTTPPKLSAEDWELHPSQVLVEARLGHGTFGEVFRGMIHGGAGLCKSRGPLSLNGVAIKLLKSE